MLVVKENGRLIDELSRTTSVWIASFVFFLTIQLFPFVVVVSPATLPLPLLLLLLLVPQKSRSSNGGSDERRSFTHPEHQGNYKQQTKKATSLSLQSGKGICCLVPTLERKSQSIIWLSFFLSCKTSSRLRARKTLSLLLLLLSLSSSAACFPLKTGFWDVSGGSRILSLGPRCVGIMRSRFCHAPCAR
jgi:hypothetical protein